MLQNSAPLTTLLCRYLAVFMVLLAGCEMGFGPGVLDWSYDLPDGSCIWRSSSHTIEVHGRIEIPAKVVELDFDKRFLIAKQQHLTERSPGDSYMTPENGRFSWWIGDFRAGKTYGPLNEEEFAERCVALRVPSQLLLHDVCDYRPADN